MASYPIYYVYSYDIVDRAAEPVEVWPREKLGRRSSLAGAQGFAALRCRVDQGLPANVTEVRQVREVDGSHCDRQVCRFNAHLDGQGVLVATAFTLDLTVLSRT